MLASNLVAALRNSGQEDSMQVPRALLCQDLFQFGADISGGSTDGNHLIAKRRRTVTACHAVKVTIERKSTLHLSQIQCICKGLMRQVINTGGHRPRLKQLALPYGVTYLQRLCTSFSID